MSIPYPLEFEKPLSEIEAKINALEATPSGAEGPPIKKELGDLRRAHGQLLKKIYANLTPWDTVRVARHPKRPQFRDYVGFIWLVITRGATPTRSLPVTSAVRTPRVIAKPWPR
jgi:acetyl-CoA carboxylase carboxyl transferase subunit alpha